MIATQLIMAAIIDYFGLLGTEIRHLNMSRLPGMRVMSLEVWRTSR